MLLFNTHYEYCKTGNIGAPLNLANLALRNKIAEMNGPPKLFLQEVKVNHNLQNANINGRTISGFTVLHVLYVHRLI